MPSKRVAVVLPTITRAAAEGLEINRSIMGLFLFSFLVVLRGLLLIFAARALLKEKLSAPRWAFLYGAFALLTVPADTLLIYGDG